jgi:hypothetical protein
MTVDVSLHTHIVSIRHFIGFSAEAVVYNVLHILDNLQRVAFIILVIGVEKTTNT